jgi:LysR family transcriptional regulator, benzoate and cis,cis-muconate-responsive activator of ben and cat genes
MANLPTIRQLQCFIAVAEEGSFRRAADRLRLSQPPLTRQIQMLEGRLKCRLLHRNTQGVELSHLGRRFLEHIRPILGELESAVEGIAADQNNPSASIAIGVTTVVEMGIFPDFRAIVSAIMPDSSLRVERAISLELFERLLKEDIDFAIVGLPSDVPAPLVVERLYDEPLLIAMSSLHSNALRETISLRA